MTTRTFIAGMMIGASIALFPPWSAAADTPSELDLRAAYCLRVTEASIKLMADAPKPPTKMLEQLRGQVMKKQEEKRDQLAAYVKSRPALFEADATRDALKTVDSDAKIDGSGRRTILDSCAAQCKSTNPPPTAEARTCVDACAKDDPVVKRLERCTTVEWLSESVKK
jgi:hypothetical protein